MFAEGGLLLNTMEARTLCSHQLATKIHETPMSTYMAWFCINLTEVLIEDIQRTRGCLQESLRQISKSYPKTH